MILFKAGAAVIALTISSLTLPATVEAQTQEPFVVEGRLDPNLEVRYVSYRDLNLGLQEGVDRLNRRVRATARSLCFDEGRVALWQETDSRRCFQDSMAHAQPQIDAAVASFRIASAQRPGIRIAAR